MSDQKDLIQHPLQKWIEDEELENVLSLPKQLKRHQCEKLVAEFSKEEIADTLYEMENFAQLKKKYRSVYLTLRQWIKLKRRREAQMSSGKKGSVSGLFTWKEALDYMERNNLGRDHYAHFEPVKNGDKTYWKKK